MPHPMIVLLSFVMLCLHGTAHASDPFEWSTPPPEEQLANDDTEIPLDKGAVFVPVMTDPLSEPPVILVSGDTVLDVPTGQRVILDPGPYTLIVSSGSPGQGTGVAVDVVEGETTLVPVTWGALRIEVTDTRRIPHRGGYELIRADTREPYGTGFGADTLGGESLLTWLLPPGVYRIVRPGENYRTQDNFATVYVPPSGFVRYRLVMDRETGEFLGSGVLLPDEIGSFGTTDSPWVRSLILGADGSFATQRNLVGLANQTVLSGNVFLDGQLSWKKDETLLTGLMQIEAGATQLRPQGSDPLPFVKSRDRWRLDLLGVRFLRDDIGPYVRAAAETQAFQSNLLATQDVTFHRTFADGSTELEPVTAGDTFHVANPWSPTIIREGAGVNTRVANNRWFNLNFRLGLGLRQNLYNNAWQRRDDPDTAAIEYFEIETQLSEGFESTIVAQVRGPGWLIYATQIELFADINTLGKPIAEWRNTLTLRLTRNLSFNYFANFTQLNLLPDDGDPDTIDNPLQTDQSILLRASFAVF